MMSTNTKRWSKSAKEPSGLLPAQRRHFLSFLELSLHATALIVSIVLQRGIQGAESKEPQRNRCPQEGPYGQRERRGILCSC